MLRTMDIEDIDIWADETGIELLKADGFDNAIIGVVRKFNAYSILYDYEKCIQILVERDDMTLDEADEYMEYNVVGAWVGDNTPVFLVGEKT